MFQSKRKMCRATSLKRKRTPLGPYRTPMPGVLGGWTLSYERGTPVFKLDAKPQTLQGAGGFEFKPSGGAPQGGFQFGAMQ